jgi:topoisomerase IA-like protein
MSKLDKDKVLAEYEEAYNKAHGKKPAIKASNGWYSVDGGKNVRLAQLAEEAKTLAGGKTAEKKAPAKKTESKKPASKASTTKKPAAKKAPAKKSAASGGLTAKELWRQKLEQDATECRLPRGSA